MIRDDVGHHLSPRLSAIRVAGVYIGTIVGAGFATGQEILQFFTYFGVSGVWGIVLSTALFVVYGAVAFLSGHRLAASSHLEVVREGGGPILGLVVDWIITFFLFAAFAAMAAGAGAVFQEQFGVPAGWGGFAMVGISVATVLLGIRGVISVISYTAPLLFGSVLLFCLIALFQGVVDWSFTAPARAALPSWPVASVAYTSYNLVLSIAVLAPTGRLAHEAELRKGALLGGLGLGLSALAIHLSLLTRMPDAARVEVPMLLLLETFAPAFTGFYTVVLLAEVYTTAVGSLYGLVSRVAKAQEGTARYTLTTAVSGVFAFLGSLIGFSELVARVYSGVGVVGFLLLIILTRAAIRLRKM